MVSVSPWPFLSFPRIRAAGGGYARGETVVGCLVPEVIQMIAEV